MELLVYKRTVRLLHKILKKTKQKKYLNNIDELLSFLHFDYLFHQTIFNLYSSKQYFFFFSSFFIYLQNK